MRWLLILLLALPALAQRTVRPAVKAGDRIQVGTNWIYFTESNGRLESHLAFQGGDIGWLQFRRDTIPNNILYFGSVALEGNNAVYLQLNGSTNGNTDPRVRLRYSDAANPIELDFKERSLYYNSGDLGSNFTTFIYWVDLPNSTLYFGTNNTKATIRGSTITADSNLVAGAALAMSPVTVAVAADNQVVSTTNRSFIKFTSDAAAASRTIILTPSNIPGAHLTIMFTGANGIEMLDDQAQTGGGTTRLIGTLTFTDQDLVTLIFEGTDWRQVTTIVNN